MHPSSGGPSRIRNAQPTQPTTDPGLSASSSAPLRPVSRSSIRPSSSNSIRPSSSAPTAVGSSRGSSTRPGSSLSTTRPASSLSALRPVSSLSTRPSSRLTQRPGSRTSQRPVARQSTRLVPFYQNLVTQVTGLNAENDDENFRTAVEFVSRNLDLTSRPSGNVDMSAIDKHIRGYVASRMPWSNFDALLQTHTESSCQLS